MELDHIGIAVDRIDRALADYRSVARPERPEPELVASQGVRVAFLDVGGSHLELLEPVGPDSAVGRFLEKRGGGLHHLAFRVPSVDRALAEVRARGGRLIDASGRPGARGRRVGFAHPSAFGGTLVEFVEAAP
jgi:methylmalonyl-CoA/ethylmalonyl-CoA epimerase